MKEFFYKKKHAPETHAISGFSSPSLFFKERGTEGVSSSVFVKDTAPYGIPSRMTFSIYP